MENITIEQLAQLMGKEVWEKGNLKRIYLDCGYNTKKMSTKTFVWQNEDGKFIVSCRIDCPSQSPNWIASQEKSIKDSIYEWIVKLTSDLVYVLCTKNGEYSDTSGNISDLYEATTFYSENAVKEYLSKNNWHNLTYVVLNKDFYTEEYNRIFQEVEKEAEKMRQERKEEQRKQEAPNSQLKEEKNTIEKRIVYTYREGTKIKHPKFGEGKVLSESEELVTILFTNIKIGEKKFLKQFIKLEILNDEN